MRGAAAQVHGVAVQVRSAVPYRNMTTGRTWGRPALRGTVLGGAVLGGAVLRGAVLGGAVLGGAASRGRPAPARSERFRPGSPLPPAPARA